MESFIITIKDIEDIKKPKILEYGIVVVADGKSDAIDKAHDIAMRKFPNIKRLVEVKRA